MASTAVAARPTVATGAIPGGYRHIGSPTIYKPEYCDAMIEFFEAAQLPGDLAPDDSGPGSGRRQAERIYTHLPTLQAFARTIGTHVQRLYEWEKRHSAFAEACARARSIMDQHMAQGLASGVYNPTGGMFVAKNLAGWKDKTEVETTVKTEDTEAMRDLKAMMAVATPDELGTFAGLMEAWQARLAATPAVEAGA